MQNSKENVFVFGGTGYLGNYVINELLKQNYRLTILVHKTNINIQNPNLEIIEGDILNPSTYKNALEKADIVINLVGIIKERGKDITFEKLHFEATKNIVDLLQIQKNGQKRYIHTSALGVSENPVSNYFATKLKAEKYIQKTDLNWTIFRPSIIWSKNSDFVKQLKMLVSIPVFTPIIGDGKNKFQPINVEKVAEIFVNSIRDENSFKKIIPLGGDRIITFEEMISEMEERKKIHLKIPIRLAGIVIQIFEKLHLPFPITYDQFRMLQIDNIVTEK